MKNLRRLYIDGGTYFFTVVMQHRRPILCHAQMRKALRNAIQKVRIDRPFNIIAWVLLPDHLHTIWTLPENDSDYSTRWRLVKGSVSHHVKDILDVKKERTLNQIRKQESGLWQHRFWEHTIRDEADLEKHFDYIHFNPVKHGLVEIPSDWKWSTYHKYVKQGFYNNERQPFDRDIDAE